MPFYEYECANCKFYVEVMQKISEAPLKKCPSCGKSALKKLISAPVFRLKGGGWYETDFKSDKEGKRNLAGGDDGPDTKAHDAAPATPAADAKAGDAKASDTKQESKPDKKAASGDSGGTANRSSAKSAGAKSAKPAARPASRPSAKAPARKSTPKAKAKAGKRRGR